MQKTLFSLYELIVLRKPLVSLLIALLVIGWLSTNIPNFKLDASADSLVLEGDESLKYYREIGQRYASEEFLFITYSPHKDLFAPESLARLDQLRGELAALEGVSSVTTILDIPLLESPPVSLDEVVSGEGIRSLRDPDIDFELVKKELVNSPIYEQLLTNPDNSTTGLQVNLARDEQYQQLLQAREILRQKRDAEGLTSEEVTELARLESEFRDYSLAASEKQGRLVEKVRQLINNYRDEADVFIGGVPMIVADMIAFVKSDLVTFGTGILLFIILTLAIIFRRVIWVIVPLLTCLLTASFMLGLITWFDWRMTVISSNFVAILLIITLSITIHLVVRYRELAALDPDMSQQELVKRTTMLMAKPCIYTALTTNVAFASLVISGIQPVIDFGWMMTVGVTAALCITFVILPTCLLLLPKPRISENNGSGPATTLRFAAITEHNGTLILISAFVLTAASAYGISQLEVENRFIDYFHESTDIYQGMEVIDAQLGGTIPLDIIIDADPEEETIFPVLAETDNVADGQVSDSLVADAAADDFAEEEFGDEFDDAFGDQFGDDFGDDFADDFSEEGGSETSYWFNKAGLARIEAVHDYIDAQEETGKVLSLATSYKMLRGITTGIDDIQLALMQRSMPDDIQSFLFHPYLDEDIDQARISIRVKETSHSLRRDQFLKDVYHHLTTEMGFHEDQVHLTGMLVLYNNMLQSLYRSQILTIGVVFIAIVFMFVILFRSISVALIAIAPNLLAAGVVLGGMGLAGIPLDIMTVTIAAIAVGIAVDDTIHYVHRFKAEFKKDNNYVATMYRCHGSIGKAMFYTSVIIVVGFSILALSNFNPSIYFGLLTGTAMFAALMGALLLLPQLLITFKPLGPNQSLETETA